VRFDQLLDDRQAQPGPASGARNHCAPVSVHFTISLIVPLLAPVSTRLVTGV
jgi:hypothetical protein